MGLLAIWHHWTVSNASDIHPHFASFLLFFATEAAKMQLQWPHSNEPQRVDGFWGC